MKLITLLLLIHLISSIIAFGQVTEEWARTYNAGVNTSDNANALTQDASGNIYVTGSADGNIVTIKYNPQGAELWTAVYNGPANWKDEGFAIKSDDMGNIYITGISYVDTSYDIITIKYNSSGVEQWNTLYEYSEGYFDKAICISIGEDGSVYIAGGSNFSYDWRYLTIKYNSSGVLQWVADYDAVASGIEFANSMEIDGNGFIYVTGISDDHFATVKYNSSGTEMWSARYHGPGNGFCYAQCLQLDGSGNVYVTGKAQDSLDAVHITTIKYNNAGVSQWTRFNSMGGTPNDMTLDNSGNIIITGTQNYDYITLKYDPQGNELWSKLYNGPQNRSDFSYAVAVDNQDNVYVTGTVNFISGIINKSDIGTLKLDSDGNEVWSKIYNGVGDSTDAGADIIVDTSYNVYITGSSVGINTASDYTTIKYSQTIGIQQISSQIPASFNLHQNYPNPFNPSTIIRFDIPSGELVSLKIYNSLGQEVANLVNKELTAGSYEYIFDGSDLSSGVYFYTLKTKDFIDSKKMLLVK